MLGLQYARQADNHPIIRGERDMEANRARVMSSPAFAAAQDVSATLHAAVTTNVTNVVNLDGRQIAQDLKPYLAELIANLIQGVSSQLLEATNEVASYHHARIAHN
jgi:hypothetical protein